MSAENSSIRISDRHQQCQSDNTRSRSTTTTVLHFGRLRGLSLDIIFVLCDEDQPLRTVDVANALGKPREIVYQYLRRMVRMKLIDYEEELWSALGSAVKIYKLLKRRQKDNTKITLRRQKDNTFISAVIKHHQDFTPKFLKLDEWFTKANLSEVEEVVVKVLEQHYNQTAQQGRAQPFIYLEPTYESLEENGFKDITFETLRQAITRLRKDGVCYFIPAKDIPGTWKLGFYKDFIEKRKVIER